MSPKTRFVLPVYPRIGLLYEASRIRSVHREAGRVRRVKTSTGSEVHAQIRVHSVLTSYSLLPTPYYSLLPTPYSLLPTAYCLLPTAYCLLPASYSLLPTTYGSWHPPYYTWVMAACADVDVSRTRACSWGGPVLARVGRGWERGGLVEGWGGATSYIAMCSVVADARRPVWYGSRQ